MILFVSGGKQILIFHNILISKKLGHFTKIDLITWREFLENAFLMVLCNKFSTHTYFLHKTSEFYLQKKSSNGYLLYFQVNLAFIKTSTITSTLKWTFSKCYFHYSFMLLSFPSPLLYFISCYFYFTQTSELWLK